MNCVCPFEWTVDIHAAFSEAVQNGAKKLKPFENGK